MSRASRYTIQGHEVTIPVEVRELLPRAADIR